MNSATTSREFFEQMYAESSDPWHFASSAYERSRYASTLQALRHRHYQRTFEPGCSIGVLTQGLAQLSDFVESIDISGTAVQTARARCRKLHNVTVHCGALPQDIPPGSFDLIVFSEIGYYFQTEVLRALGRELVQRLREGGILLAVHWLGTSQDHVLSGDQVHAILCELGGLSHDYAERYSAPTQNAAGSRDVQGFRLDRWVRQ